jgi:hypothetical protein
MYIRMTHTVEYTIEIDDDNTIALNEVDAVLQAHQVLGGDMSERVWELYQTDPASAMRDLSALHVTELTEETWVCDHAEGPEPEDEDEDEDADSESAAVLA